MARKLTVRKLQQIARLREKGLTYKEIAEKARVSAGSVRNALKEAPAPDAKPEKREPLGAPDGAPSVSPGEARAFLEQTLAEQLTDLRAQVNRAKKDGDEVEFHRASRQLNATALLIRQLQKQAEGEPDGVFVTVEQISQCAVQFRTALHELVGAKLVERRTAPKKAAKKKKAKARRKR